MKPNLATAGPLAALTVILATGTACAGQSGGLGQQDQTYLTQNAQTDMAEIAGGQLAVQKGTTDGVRATGQTLMQDHQRALDQVKSIAQAKHVTLPSTPDQTQQLKNASGIAFDQTYLRSEIQAHQQSIGQTQQELRSGTDPQVKQFAQSYLSVAEAHLQRLDTDQRQLATSTPKAANTGSGGQAAATPRGRLVGGLAGGGALLVFSAAALFARGRRHLNSRG